MALMILPAREKAAQTCQTSTQLEQSMRGNVREGGVGGRGHCHLYYPPNIHPTSHFLSDHHVFKI